MTIRGIQTQPALPKTSVIVPCHNYGRYLSWALASILHQTKPAREILVIDDSSDDETAEVARSYGDQVRYFRVSFRCAQRTRNFGLEQAQGEYVLFLDADDFLDNFCLEIFERELDENPPVKLAYSGRFHFGSESLIQQFGFGFCWIPPRFRIELLRQANFIPMPSLFRRSGFPGFDPRIRRLQDWDAWLGLLTSDEDARCVPVPLHHARFHGTNKTVLEPYASERLKVLAKHGLIDVRIAARTNQAGLDALSSETANAGVFVVAFDLDDTAAQRFLLFARSLNNRFLGGIVHTRSKAASQIIDRSRKTLRAVVETRQDNSLDGLISDARHLNEFLGATWLVLGNFSAPFDLDMPRHIVASGVPVILAQSADSVFDLHGQPSIVFNQPAIQRMLQMTPAEVSAQGRQVNVSFKRAFSRVWQRHIGWRFTSRK